MNNSSFSYNITSPINDLKDNTIESIDTLIYPLHIENNGSGDPMRIEGIAIDNDLQKMLMVNDSGIIKYKEFCCTETLTPILSGTEGDYSWMYTDETGSQYQFSIDTIGLDSLVFNFDGITYPLVQKSQWRDTICDCKTDDITSPSYILSNVGINVNRPESALDINGQQQIRDDFENIYITTNNNSVDRFSNEDNILLGTADTITGESDNILIGNKPGLSMIKQNILIGKDAATLALGSSNIIIGSNSVSTDSNILPVYLNTIVGSNNLMSFNEIGGYNSIYGNSIARNSRIKFSNNFFGSFIGSYASIDSSNLIIGNSSLFQSQILNSNLLIGNNIAFQAEQLSHNTLIGNKTSFKTNASALNTISVTESVFDMPNNQLQLSTLELSTLLAGAVNSDGSTLIDGDKISLFIDSDCGEIIFNNNSQDSSYFQYEIIDVANGLLGVVGDSISSICVGQYLISIDSTRFSIEESTAIGFNSKIEHSNQVVIGQEENEEVMFNGFLKFNKSYNINGTSVDKGSLFKGHDGNLYWKSDGGVVTRIN